MDAYPLPARPLPTDTEVAPIVDLRTVAVDTSGLDGLSPWLWCVEYVRRRVAVSPGRGRLVQDSIKAFDTRSGSDQAQFARVLAALDDGRPVAFYGWWPTAELAGVSDILGVDAMDVPPPDRKGRGLADGHAVVVLGYGRHAAFPGGGYLIARNPWADAGWGHGGDGYLPFTYLRAYATALRTFRIEATEVDDHRSGDPVAAPGPSARTRAAATLDTRVVAEPIDRVISRRARCHDPRSSYTRLFFSDDSIDINRAKAICARCTVRELCLRRAIERAEPYGVWGGEFVYEGSVVALKRGRGRPRQVPLSTIVDEVTGIPVVA